MCYSEDHRKRRGTTNIVKEGWTQFFLSTDTPHEPANSKNPGEHEHYFFFANNQNHKRTEVYDSNGNEFTKCDKKAIIVRSRNEHKYWWDLRTDYTLRMVCNLLF